MKRAEPQGDARIVAEAYIPAPQWASIVATVGVGGETEQTWQIVLALHGDVNQEYAEKKREEQEREGRRPPTWRYTKEGQRIPGPA